MAALIEIAVIAGVSGYAAMRIQRTRWERDRPPVYEARHGR